MEAPIEDLNTSTTQPPILSHKTTPNEDSHRTENNILLPSALDGPKLDDFVKLHTRGKDVADVRCHNGQSTIWIRTQSDPRSLAAFEPHHRHTLASLGDGCSVIDEALVDTLAADPEQHLGRYDAVTSFNFNVGLPGRDAFVRAVARMVKPDDGIFVMSLFCRAGFCDKSLNYPDEPRLRDVLEKYFGRVEVEDVADSDWGRCVVACAQPLLEEE